MASRLAADAREVFIPSSGGDLSGVATLPEPGQAFILFAHGSGSSRRSPRNQFVATRLNEAGFGTLLFDLLTEREDEEGEIRFDIPLLTERLGGAVRWARDHWAGMAAPIGLFGASTGAAAALATAAELPETVRAVVSRGGRPDMAGLSLAQVRCPTLLIVGELDHEVADLNREAIVRMPGSTVTQLTILPHATHLFPEPGCLERVADLAIGWFHRHAH